MNNSIMSKVVSGGPTQKPSPNRGGGGGKSFSRKSAGKIS